MKKKRKNMHKIGRHKTVMYVDNNDVCLKLYNDIIMRINDDRILLDTHGFFTNMTMTRMNQASNQLKLGYWITEDRETGIWKVRFNKQDILFESDSLTLTRSNKEQLREIRKILTKT